MNKGTKKLQRLLKEVRTMSINEYKDLFESIKIGKEKIMKITQTHKRILGLNIPIEPKELKENKDYVIDCKNGINGIRIKQKGIFEIEYEGVGSI